MIVIETISDMRELLLNWVCAENSIGFVPTMGNLHAGHLALISQAKENAGKTVVSIFVNPLQFSEDEDFSTYPRTLNDDLAQLEKLKVDAVFMPTMDELYPQGKDAISTIEVPAVSEGFCSVTRPHFFTGVATIVCKLFNIIQPTLAVFGKKDYQQGLVIQKMVTDLNIPTEIIMGETCREADGLALSSRNRYLDVTWRAKAPVLYKALKRMKTEILSGNRDYASLEMHAIADLATADLEADYLSICCRQTLVPAKSQDRELVILAACFAGKTRLIDNIELTL